MIWLCAYAAVCPDAVFKDEDLRVLEKLFLCEVWETCLCLVIFRQTWPSLCFEISYVAFLQSVMHFWFSWKGTEVKTWLCSSMAIPSHVSDIKTFSTWPHAALSQHFMAQQQLCCSSCKLSTARSPSQTCTLWADPCCWAFACPNCCLHVPPVALGYLCHGQEMCVVRSQVLLFQLLVITDTIFPAIATFGCHCSGGA